MSPRVWRTRIVLLLALVLGLAACAGEAATPTPTQPSQGGAPTPTPTTSTSGGNPTPTPTQEFDAAAYFSGKTIVIIDGFSPGGGSDTLARMFAVVAPRHFPGSPRFIVRNLPGSGGLRGLNTTLTSDPTHPTTLTLGMVHSRFVKQTIAGDPIEGFDLSRIKWIGVPDLGFITNALYVRRAVGTSWDEIKALGRDITVGSPAPGSSAASGPEFLDAIGGPVNMVFGYGGTSEVLAAFDRGEIDGTGSASQPTVERLFPEWIPNQFHLPVFWWGAPIDDTYREYLSLLGADEPIHIFDTMEMTDEQKTTFDVVENVNLLGSRTFFLPPDTPEPVYQAVREAWEATVQDPEYIELKLTGGFDAEYIPAQRITEIINQAGTLSEEGIQLFRTLAGI